MKFCSRGEVVLLFGIVVLFSMNHKKQPFCPLRTILASRYFCLNREHTVLYSVVCIVQCNTVQCSAFAVTGSV